MKNQGDDISRTVHIDAFAHKRNKDKCSSWGSICPFKEMLEERSDDILTNQTGRHPVT